MIELTAFEQIHGVSTPEVDATTEQPIEIVSEVVLVGSDPIANGNIEAAAI